MGYTSSTQRSTKLALPAPAVVKRLQGPGGVCLLSLFCVPLCFWESGALLRLKAMSRILKSSDEDCIVVISLWADTGVPFHQQASSRLRLGNVGDVCARACVCVCARACL